MELGAALGASEMAGKPGLAMGMELGAALGAAEMACKLGLAMGMELGAALEASEMAGKLGLAMGMELASRFKGPRVAGKLGLAMGGELGAGVEDIGWMLGGMSGAGTKVLRYLELVLESWRSLGLVVLLESWWNRVAVGLKTATSTPCGRSCRGIVFHVLIITVFLFIIGFLFIVSRRMGRVGCLSWRRAIRVGLLE